MCIRDRYQRRVRGVEVSTMQLFALVAASIAAIAYADNYAVIIAGSSGFYNYRHQADACHAYQIMKKNGIPESNIILMMADDVANDPSNPFPGKLFNKPTAAGTPGVDVYEGCKATYTGAEKIGQKLFLDVLQGKKSATAHTVLESTSTDNVFINFVDHGGVGIIAMPNGDLLKSKDLVAALQAMHTSKMYSKLVFYMEACESGSMFQGLPSGLNIYATTAANAKESSWGTYCSPDDKVDGKSIGSCLGDLYSVNWMEDSDKSGEMQSETLESQFKLVTKETTKSHCEEFGDVSKLSSLPIHDFQGTESGVYALRNSTTPAQPDTTAEDLKQTSAVDSRDIALVSKFHRYLETGCPMKAQELIDEITMREQIKAKFAKIAEITTGEHAERMMTSRSELATESEWDCHHNAIDAVIAACGKFNDYSLKFSMTLANLCKQGVTATQISTAAQKACL
eukprot:TRINITY_DN1363_c0_g1_i1.p1 TRINITY_DN1363_c0_g1~~TRINITY_DN1363_c0_g1_i1.p1  ORF type:complete len:454 (+),score=180.11 TRINITY_DN1363_c0_g1_i1:200-1561(+)